MASVRSTSAVNRNTVQGVIPAAGVAAALQGSQQRGQETLEAEFSRLVEQIAGQVGLPGSESEILGGFAVAPVAAQQASRTSTSKEPKHSDRNPSDERASRKEIAVKQEAQEGKYQESKPEIKGGAGHQESKVESEGPVEKTEDLEVSDAQVVDDSAEIEVTEVSANASQPVASSIAASTLVETQSDEKTELPLDEEGKPDNEDAEDNSAEQEDSTVQGEGFVTGMGEEVTAAPQEKIAARSANSPVKLEETAAATPQGSAVVNDSSTELPANSSEQIVAQTLNDIGADRQSKSAMDRQAKLALEQIMRASSERLDSSLLNTPLPKPTFDRDALVSVLALRPVLEMAQRNVDVSKVISSSTPSPTQSVVSELNAAKTAARNTSDTAARATRPSGRVSFEQAMERVESVAKEVARSRDGHTLTFRLDPPQLGNLKVDISLRDGALHARLVPENAQVAQLLRERAQDLQVTLRKMGLSVDSVSVSVSGDSSSFEAPGGNQSTFSSQHQEGAGSKEGGSGRGRSEKGGVANPGAASANNAANGSLTDHWVA